MPDCYNKIFLKEKEIFVNCGKCLNCLENKKKEHAARFINEIESEKYINKYFITLTYDEIMAPRDSKGRTTLSKEHLKKYIKSLQYLHKRHYQESGSKYMKYIASGEYGEKTQRAHYHIVLATNIFIERSIRNNWKYGHVRLERVKDIKAIYYTAGYTSKKENKINRDKYREVAFIQSSRGNGKKWIYEAIASGKVNENNYFINFNWGKNKLPIYYKNKIKEYIMGVKPIYRKYNEEFRKKIINCPKTYMENRNEYDANLYKWELFINKVQINMRKNDPIYYKYDYMKKVYGDTWKERLHNMMTNKNWDDLSREEKEFSTLLKRRNELLKIKAEQKELSKINKRMAI